MFGKAGRAETATDPAPLSMMETTVVLKPETEWRKRRAGFDLGAGSAARHLGNLWPEHISHEELVSEMDQALRIPAHQMRGPCQSRPASTCCRPACRTPIGIKVIGSDAAEIGA